MQGDGDSLTTAVERDMDPLRVLVAEDNPVNQFLLLTILESVGCHVHVAGDGKAAIELALSHEYDLILMDQHMPGMDGPETVAAIRQLDSTVAAAPIIAVAIDGEDASRFHAAADDFVAKPLDPVLLFDAISRVTGFAPSAAALAEIVDGLAAIRAPNPTNEPIPINTEIL